MPRPHSLANTRHSLASARRCRKVSPLCAHGRPSPRSASLAISARDRRSHAESALGTPARSHPPSHDAPPRMAPCRRASSFSPSLPQPCASSPPQPFSSPPPQPFSSSPPQPCASSPPQPCAPSLPQPCASLPQPCASSPPQPCAPSLPVSPGYRRANAEQPRSARRRSSGRGAGPGEAVAEVPACVHACVRAGVRACRRA